MWFPFTGPSKPVVLFVILDGQQQSPANWSLVLVSGAHELQLHDVRLCEYPWLTARRNRRRVDVRHPELDYKHRVRHTYATWRTWRWVVFCYSLRSFVSLRSQTHGPHNWIPMHLRICRQPPRFEADANSRARPTLLTPLWLRLHLWQIGTVVFLVIVVQFASR